MGRHPYEALSAVKVRNLKVPGRYTDGKGLHLYIDKHLRKRWVLRVVVKGAKRVDVGLGGYPDVSLAEAREEAKRLRRLARKGIDPIQARRTSEAALMTFKEAAKRVHEAHKPSWRNPKHADQWINTLETYVFPTLGDKAISKATPADVLTVLAPIWLTKPETARRVRQRIRAVFDWAKASGNFVGDNPVDGVAKALPRQNDKARHHPALPHKELPAFIEKLRAETATDAVKLCLEFTILTATRTSETVAARWEEFDLDKAVWTIPAKRMKAQREHRVPLSPRCLEILRLARELSNGHYVFPGQSKDKPLSNMAMLKLVKRMNSSLTVHGFRSTFRDWAAESTNFPRDVAEAALAHTLEDKTEAAYKRTDLFEKRRDLMNAWAVHARGRGHHL